MFWSNMGIAREKTSGNDVVTDEHGCHGNTPPPRPPPPSLTNVRIPHNCALLQNNALITRRLFRLLMQKSDLISRALEAGWCLHDNNNNNNADVATATAPGIYLLLLFFFFFIQSSDNYLPTSRPTIALPLFTSRWMINPLRTPPPRAFN